MVTGEVLLMILLALVARFLIPKMLYSEAPGVRFAVGVVLLGIYTVICLALCRYLCTVDGSLIAELSGAEVWKRVVSAFLLTNLCVLLAACIFFFTREKRVLTQKEKMKLKDL